MTFLSLFAGIGGIDLACERHGFRAVAQVEIDPQCRRVLAHHFPGVPLHPDVHLVGRRNLPLVRVVCGGFPCQDLSVAGKRSGLSGERSGLWYEMLRVVDELRAECLVWENVPGLLSSDERRDFPRILRSLADCGYFGAWRVLDAQFCGVPQRRRRVFGVFFRDRLGAYRAAEVLALAEGVPWHPEAGSEAREDVAGTLGGGTAKRGWNDDLDRCGTFIASNYTDGAYEASELAGPLTTGTDLERSVPVVVAAATFDERNVTSKANRTRCGFGQPSQTLHESALGVVAAIGGNNTKGEIELATACNHHSGRQDFESETIIVHTLRASGCDGSEDGTGRGVPRGALPDPSAKSPRLIVRRLTPLECLRLQGLPDDWLDLDPPLSDSAKYRMIGNSVAVPCVAWIARRLARHLKEKKAP